MPESLAYNRDCMAAMAEMPDKAFELAIVDPPYGIGASNMQLGTGKRKLWKKGDWDAAPPDAAYFIELSRVSINQIIWGANHFTKYLPSTRGWIFWDKMTDGFSESYSSGELAFTSFDRSLKQFTYKQQGNYCGLPGSITTITSSPEMVKIHPTQKPVALYKWLLTNYAKPGDRILDTHLGSGSSRIAAYDLGFDFTGYELDADYFEAQEERFANHVAQPKLFTPTAEPVEQASLI